MARLFESVSILSSWQAACWSEKNNKLIESCTPTHVTLPTWCPTLGQPPILCKSRNDYTFFAKLSWDNQCLDKIQGVINHKVHKFSRSLPSRERVGWFGRMALKYVYYHVRNEVPVYVWYRIQDAWSWCMGMIQRDDMGWEGDSGLGACIHPWWIHVNVWQNQYSIVK